MTKKDFTFVFSSVINHINTVCLVCHSRTICNKSESITKYIFNTVDSLFTKDIYQNFIILATFANKDTINEEPEFVKKIKNDEDFLIFTR